jgi:hypothetical protein
MPRQRPIPRIDLAETANGLSSTALILLQPGERDQLRGSVLRGRSAALVHSARTDRAAPGANRAAGSGRREGPGAQVPRVGCSACPPPMRLPTSGSRRSVASRSSPAAEAPGSPGACPTSWPTASRRFRQAPSRALPSTEEATAMPCARTKSRRAACREKPSPSRKQRSTAPVHGQLPVRRARRFNRERA